MKKTLRPKSFNSQIINSLMAIGLLLFVGGGCQKINELANSTSTKNPDGRYEL